MSTFFFFTLFNVTIRKLELTYVIHIMFLLDSALLTLEQSQGSGAPACVPR